MRSFSAGELVMAELRAQWMRDLGKRRWILAVSGGIDSMVLLEACARILERPGDRACVHVAHVNHCLRGEESDQDEFLVLSRARELGFAVSSFRLQWSGRATEDACRRRREEYFRSLNADGTARLLLAHHLDDQAETVLMRLFRGCGARGLRGMRVRNGWKLRPFLGLEKKLLRTAASEWGLLWREDSSNRDSSHCERNWLRLELMPEIEARHPGLRTRLAALAEEAAGWPLDPGLRPFRVGESSFFCPGPGLSRESLAATFPLSRQALAALQKLLKASSGRLALRGHRFHWSAGVLLAEHSGSTFQSWIRREPSGACSSPLGCWSFGGEGKFLDPEQCSGETVKKRFQERQVPVFFRRSIPLLRSDSGRIEIPLPGEKGVLPQPELRFTPSPLAHWWLRELRRPF